MQWLNKLLCLVFGHTISTSSYGEHWGDAIDGMGLMHGFYHWYCKRCGTRISLCVHIPNSLRGKPDYDIEE
jgi:hypothetical protein